MKNYMDFKAFRKDVNAALADVGKKYGISLEAGSIRYDENSFDVKLMGKRTDVDVAALEFKRNVVYMSGLTEDDYRREVNIKGKSYIITGLKPGNKFSVICERSDGKTYGFVKDAILHSLGRCSC